MVTLVNSLRDATGEHVQCMHHHQSKECVNATILLSHVGHVPTCDWLTDEQMWPIWH